MNFDRGCSAFSGDSEGSLALPFHHRHTQELSRPGEEAMGAASHGERLRFQGKTWKGFRTFL